MSFWLEYVISAYFVEAIAALLSVMTNKLVWKLVCGRNKKISNDQIEFAAKNLKAKLFVCELSVKRVVTFGVVLYLIIDPLISLFILLNCILVVLSDTKTFCFEIIFSNVIKSK